MDGALFHLCVEIQNCAKLFGETCLESNRRNGNPGLLLHSIHRFYPQSFLPHTEVLPILLGSFDLQPLCVLLETDCIFLLEVD